MIDQLEAQTIAQRLRISVDRILLEAWEMVFLKELCESPQGRDLVFRGGTALRLAYQAPRCSDDLDFSLLRAWTPQKFKRLIKEIVARFAEADLVDLASKFYTHLAQVKIRPPWRQGAFSIKIEISRRKEYRRGQGYHLTLLSSPASTVQVLAQVATLKRLWEEKARALRARQKARDLYDLWWISQRLHRPFKPGQVAVPRVELMRDLRKYLPQSQWPVIQTLAQLR